MLYIILVNICVTITFLFWTSLSLIWSYDYFLRTARGLFNNWYKLVVKEIKYRFNIYLFILKILMEIKISISRSC